MPLGRRTSEGIVVRRSYQLTEVPLLVTSVDINNGRVGLLYEARGDTICRSASKRVIREAQLNENDQQSV